jgi:plastocyanin
MAYIVEVKYGRFIINGESYSSIFVTTGNTITFDVSHSSNVDHPLKISETKDGTHGGGVELEDQTTINSNGTPGQANAQIQFTPALDGIFYYYCQHHANMGSSITSVQTKFTDLGATAYDAQDGDITNKITKKIYKKNESGQFDLINSISDPHVNPWEVSNINIEEQASYKIEYNVLGNDNIPAFNQPLERYINIIPAPSAPTRPEWLGENLPIDEEGRIWAIQTVHFNNYFTMPTIYPFTYSEPQLLTASFPMAVNYVVLRNDSIDGANSDFAPYSFADPSTGWDVGIPSTYDFMKPFHDTMFGRFNKHQYEKMAAFIVPPGWECHVYREPNYNPYGHLSFIGDGTRYEVSQATVFHDNSVSASLFSQEDINFNTISVSSYGNNALGAMGYWHVNGAYYSAYWGPGSGYSFLLKKAPMPT